MLATTVFTLMLAASAHGFQSYQSNIPNGANVMRNGDSWPGVGHVASGGGGTRNDFGLAFAAASHVWTTDLCNADTDGDGFSNGQELGDPNCVWTTGATPSRTTGISHPGFSDSTPSTPTPPTPAPTPAPTPPPTPPPTPAPTPPPTPAPTPPPTPAPTPPPTPPPTPAPTPPPTPPPPPPPPPPPTPTPVQPSTPPVTPTPALSPSPTPLPTVAANTPQPAATPAPLVSTPGPTADCEFTSAPTTLVLNTCLDLVSAQHAVSGQMTACIPYAVAAAQCLAAAGNLSASCPAAFARSKSRVVGAALCGNLTTPAAVVFASGTCVEGMDGLAAVCREVSPSSSGAACRCGWQSFAAPLAVALVALMLW